MLLLFFSRSSRLPIEVAPIMHVSISVPFAAACYTGGGGKGIGSDCKRLLATG